MKVFLMVVGCLLIGSFAYAEQKIVFSMESIKTRGYTSEGCVGICSKKYAEIPLEQLTANGWKILSVSPKELIGKTDEDKDFPATCTCIGNQYLLQKEDNDSNLLKKEIELLKKENEMLKTELKAKCKKPSK